MFKKYLTRSGICAIWESQVASTFRMKCQCCPLRLCFTMVLSKCKGLFQVWIIECFTHWSAVMAHHYVAFSASEEMNESNLHC